MSVEPFDLVPSAQAFLKPSWLPKIVIQDCPEPNLIGPCWLWQGACDQYGYSVVSIGPRITRQFWSLHRWTYHHFHGQLMPGYDVDHLCHVRNCFQPYHLRHVPHLENRVPAYIQADLSQEDLDAMIRGW